MLLGFSPVSCEPLYLPVYLSSFRGSSFPCDNSCLMALRKVIDFQLFQLFLFARTGVMTSKLFICQNRNWKSSTYCCSFNEMNKQLLLSELVFRTFSRIHLPFAGTGSSHWDRGKWLRSWCTEIHGLQTKKDLEIYWDFEVIITPYKMEHLILETRSSLTCFWFWGKRKDRELTLIYFSKVWNLDLNIL